MLKWDGTYLGSYDKNIIKNKWVDNGNKYYEFVFDSETILCVGNIIKDMIPCIVEDAKKIFGIYNRKFHTINIVNKKYIIYKIEPDAVDTSIKNMDDNDRILNDIKLKIQKVILFSDIMYLETINKSTIIIRKIGNMYMPTNTNTKKMEIVTDHDGTTMTPSIFKRWFDEKQSMGKMVKQMIGYDKEKCDDEYRTCTVIGNLRNKIENVIKKHDSQYIWYSDIIIGRVNWYILNY